MDGLYYYKLVSQYPEDVTKNCKLTINEIDHNFLTLKDYDISAATFVRGDDTVNKSDGTLVITRNNGDKIIIPIDVTLNKKITYDLNTNVCNGESGATLTITYKDDNGEHVTTLSNVITADNLIHVIGHDILTKVISDDSLKGLGTMTSPLGIAGIEKTGMLAPAITMLDITEGDVIPIVAKAGTRYVTREYVNDYGYLYNGDGVKKIQDILDTEYEREEIKKEVGDRKNYWRVPSKADWDALLNSIEPCSEYKNHDSAQCHIELGKFAGKYLKSECGWVNSEYECTCTGSKPYTGCTTSSTTETDDSYIDDDVINPFPSQKKIDPVGVDKFGMTVLPTGVSYFKNNTPRAEGFKETTAFWTTTEIAVHQDIYIKVFDYDKSGVYQVAECPSPYYAVRLVKDYDGSNYRDSEYINGVLYRAILFPESGQIWLASNFADKKGFITMENREQGQIPEVLDPNNGYLPNEQRIEMFINEYNGRYWEKKVMNEGDTIVLQDACFDDETATTVCWKDSDDVEHCVDVEVTNTNLEYRVYIEDDGCDKVLKNTDDLVLERILNILLPIIDNERYEREKADLVLSGAIEDLRDDLEAETEERISADTELWNALTEEISARTEADTVLSGSIEDLRDDLEAEVERAISAETEIREDLEAEIERATQREDEIEEELLEEIDRAKEREDEIDGQLINWDKNPFTMSASTEDDKDNLILPSKDENEEHSIRIKFDGNFGEI